MSAQTDALFAAIESFRVQEARWAVEQGADLDALKDGLTPLMRAALSGSEPIISMLLRSCSPLARGARGETALMMAAHGGDGHCVRALLPRSDPLACDLDGKTALMRSAIGGSSLSARLLIPVSNVAAVDVNGDTALHIALSLGHDHIAEMLIPSSDLLAPNHAGKRPVDWADASACATLGAFKRSWEEAGALSALCSEPPSRRRFVL